MIQTICPSKWEVGQAVDIAKGGYGTNDVPSLSHKIFMYDFLLINDKQEAAAYKSLTAVRRRPKSPNKGSAV